MIENNVKGFYPEGAKAAGNKEAWRKYGLVQTKEQFSYGSGQSDEFI